MSIKVKDVAHPISKDIDPNARIDVKVLDGLVNTCSCVATQVLKVPPKRYSELQAAHISWIFDGLRLTHVALRNLLREGGRTPACVDALALARLQLETLYSVCLCTQDPSFVDCYVKGFWKDNYVRFLLQREECKGLKRFDDYLNKIALPILAQLQEASGVTAEEKATVEFEELGEPLPTGMTFSKITRFPQPIAVIGHISNPDTKRMLRRLYPEYRRLCAFAHGSPQSWMFKTAFWERSRFRNLISESSRRNVFEKEVGEPAVFYSCFSVVQSACEIATVLYPFSVELMRTVTEAWNIMLDVNLLARTVWEIRTKAALGVV
jgi:hypothetical protein